MNKARSKRRKRLFFMCEHESLGFAKGGGSSVKETPRKGNKVFRETKVFKNPPFAWKFEFFWCGCPPFSLCAGTFNPKTTGLFFQNEAVGASWRQTASLSLSDSKMPVNTPKKSNNFEPFFGDSALTFLTFGNTFRLPILPSRRIIFLCLPLIKIRRRQI